MKNGVNQGTLYVVSTPIGNFEDVTLRALRVLGEVAVIAAEDPQQTQALCERHDLRVPLTSYHNENKEEKTAVLLSRLREGDSVALVSDEGTPAIADPGIFLIREAIRAGIPLVPVPGPSAGLAALTVSGLTGDRFLFLGLLPGTSVALHRLLGTLRKEPGTLLCLATAGRLIKILHAVKEVLGDRDVVVAKDLTMSGEAVVRGQAGAVVRQLRLSPIRGTVTLVVAGCRRKAGRNRKMKLRLKRQHVSGS
nr:rRNA small subunit methyltransferase 1 [Nitrospirota bacterium]